MREERADELVRQAYDEATRRIARGHVPVESYASVRGYSEAHGDAVSRGLARAARTRAEVKASGPANDTHDASETGTDSR